MSRLARWAKALGLGGHARHRAPEDPELGHQHRGGRGLKVLDDRCGRVAVDGVDENVRNAAVG